MYKEDILKTEFSEQFVDLMKNRMVFSYSKYGPLQVNYSKKLVKCIESLEKRLELYKETGNSEYLVDVANQAMIEFMCPQHPKAHFEALGSDKSPGLIGMSINEIKAFNELNKL